MFEQNKIGCVLLNYNSSDEIIGMVSELRTFQIIDYIVVVDNASQDHPKSKLKRIENRPEVTVIFNEHNDGYAVGNNIGIKYLVNEFNVDYILVANPDVSINESAIYKLLDEGVKHPKLGLISCLINSNASHVPPTAWVLPDINRCFSENLLLANKIVEKKYVYDLNKEIQKVDVICGAFFLANAKALTEIQYFDERTFLYYEENILAYRLKKLGFSNYFITTCSVFHEVSASINKKFSSYKKSKTMHDSKRIYCKYYLNFNKVQLFLLDIVFIIGVVERTIYHKLCRRKPDNNE